ncbi:ABC transporter ATP-binding protein [Rhizobium sp. AN80A]|uniref:ABC transporter ATP-binding protein n=1 Tax=Rhizobium sp. AN80A TaxID=3040673 RepID=UPI0024B3B8EB|nr:ABC transporter ATP-binding protein [Rhizobium sp. AN80A]
MKQIFLGRDDRRYFREFHALSDVSFEVHRGASFAVIGKNGAGKSTLLQLITGTLQPTSGTIEVNGKVAAVLELGAGFNTEFSGRENIELYCNLLLMPPELIKTRFDAIVDFSELHAFIDQPLKTYSSGMIARLAFSVIAHVDADILIIDEALSVGDAAFSQKCMRFLREFKKRGSIFFVSHDLSAVKSFCDSAVWLEHGRVRALGDSSRVCDAYLAEVYPSEPLQDNVGRTVKSHRSSPKAKSRFAQPSTPVATAIDRGALEIAGFNFNSSSSHFGNGDAEISSVHLIDLEGRALDFCEGQSIVQVVIETTAKAPIRSPIVGFFVKDRLGQPLFGGNTYRTYEGCAPAIEAGEMFETIFQFQLPTLMVGDYAITAAVADGTLEAHVQLHWMHDAALFKVTDSSLDGVLVGIPMQRIEFHIPTDPNR